MSKGGETAFSWTVDYGNGETSGQSIMGITYIFDTTGADDYKKIENFMNSNAEADEINNTQGANGASKGYYYQYMACIINSSDGDMVTNVKLSCGFFNKNNISKDIVLSETLIKFYPKNTKHHPHQ